MIAQRSNGRVRKESGGFPRLISNLVELRIVFAERLGNFYFGLFQNVHEGESGDYRFGSVAIVGDDESGFTFFFNTLDTFGPRFEFFFGIEIILAFVGRNLGIVSKPGVIAAAMEADVADSRSDAVSGLERTANNGLIDIAKADAALCEQIKKRLVVPGGMADFYY